MSESRIAFVFPGQGSQKPGMGQGVHDSFPDAQGAFDEISAATGIDARRLCFETPEDELRETQNAQLALFTASVATFRAIGPRVPCVAMAGHSVGEYAALACAGSISVPDGARLVQRRGDLMARAGALRPGAMAAVLGLADDAVEEACAAISDSDAVAVVANYNCPGQVVISGDVRAIGEVCERLKEAGAKRCLPLNVSGAFHSPLMKDSAVAMGVALAAVEFVEPRVPVVSNVTAEPGEDWSSLLEKQLESPVRWSASVRRMLAMGVTTFVECGPGEVLTGLAKRIAPEVRAVAVGASEAASAIQEEFGR